MLAMITLTLRMLGNLSCFCCRLMTFFARKEFVEKRRVCGEKGIILPCDIKKAHSNLNSVNSEIFARTLFLRNIAYAKFR